MTSRWIGPTLLLLIILPVAGCGGTGAKQPTASPYAMTHPRIVTHPGGNPDAFYVPNPIRVRVGQSVTWTNEDNEAHDVTADDGQFASSPIAYRASWRWKATHPGRYPYSCTLHPDMHGLIVVSR